MRRKENPFLHSVSRAHQLIQYHDVNLLSVLDSSSAVSILCQWFPLAASAARRESKTSCGARSARGRRPTRDVHLALPAAVAFSVALSPTAVGGHVCAVRVPERRPTNREECVVRNVQLIHAYRRVPSRSRTRTAAATFKRGDGCLRVPPHAPTIQSRTPPRVAERRGTTQWHRTLPW